MSRPEMLALLADVKENPDDLTPWLVLSDWLEEHGDEAERARAEYCRLCFDKFGTKTDARNWDAGERRRDLFRQYKSAWLGPLAAWPSKRDWLANSQPAMLQIRRGLLHLEAGIDDLKTLVDVPADVWMWANSVAAVLRTSEEIVGLSNWPLFEGLGEVKIHLLGYAHPTKEAVRALAASPTLAHVHRFRFFANVLHSPIHRGDEIDWNRLLAPLKERFGDRYTES